MIEAKKIFGPPGTGKTNYLISRVLHLRDELNINPRDICYITFTNKGIDEVRGRLGVTKKTEGYESFATIHGLCNRYIKGEGSKLIGISDFEYWASKERGDVKREYGSDLDNNFIIQVYNLKRVANLPLTEAFTRLNERNYKWKHVEYYVESWEKYKENNKLHDFTDQILFALQANRFQKYKAVFLDEAQDSAWCQWEVIKRLTDKGSVDYLYLAGDDDQAIFDWNGGEVKHFLNAYKNVCEAVHLEKSHRLTQQHISFANIISNRIKQREEKHYVSAREEQGEIFYTDQFVTIPLDNDESWTIMVTGARIMDEAKELLIKRRVWFKQITARGYVHYPVGTKILSALKCYFDLQKNKYVSKSDLLNYRTLVKPPNFKPKQWEGLDQDQLYNGTALEEMFDFDFEVDWKIHFSDIKNPEWQRKRRYIIDCVEKKVDIFSKYPKIELSTIHGMKGGEDVNTVIFGNMEMPFHKKYISQNNSERDAIVRMFYVACTRSKKNMYVYMCRGLPYRFNFDMIFKLHNESKEVA